jgi:protein-S-isoprenylcysteine O-methyltransferase Ste14
MMTWMYLMRTKPTGRTEFRSQKIIAFVGSFAMFFSPIQQENMSSDPVIITTALSIMVIGGIFTIYALANLRRNFSIIPEARSVVTTGPYRFIRHPMYTSEIVWSFGMILPALTWQVGAAYALMLTCLILRAGFEEAVLEKHFPEYGEFRKKTWRFIPLVY